MFRNQYDNYGNYYNPYQNSPYNQFNNNNRMFNRPINTPRSKMPIKVPTRSIAPKFTFSKFLNGTQEVISTVATAIPLYTQVKPLFGGLKGVTKGITSKLFRSNNKKVETEIIDNPEIITPNEKKNKQESNQTKEFKEQNSPNRPFF